MLGISRAGLRLSYAAENIQPYLQFDVVQRIGEVIRGIYGWVKNKSRPRITLVESISRNEWPVNSQSQPLC